MSDPRLEIGEKHFAALGEFFGHAHPWHWPRFPMRRTRNWLQISARRTDALIDAAFLSTVGRRFSDADCGRFHAERLKGQLFEDAGGFLWRCWAAALGIPYDDGFGRIVDVPEDIADGIGRDMATITGSIAARHIQQGAAP